MALEMQLGVFIAFLAIPFISLLFLGKIKTWGFIGYIMYVGFGVLGFIMLGGLALAFASGFDVVFINQAEGYSSNEITRNGSGDIVTNSTVTIPPTRTVTPIIDAYHTMWAYIFLGAAILFGLLYFKVLITGSVT